MIAGYGDTENLDKTLINNVRTSTIVDIDTPNINVTHHIDGKIWKVNYFNQLLAEDDLSKPLDNDSPDNTQSYTLIKDFTLKVTTPIESNNLETSGNGVIMDTIRPNEGDYFEAFILDNRRALFLIESVEMITYNLNKMYSVTFTLDTFLHPDKTRYLDLLTKTIRIYQYIEGDLEEFTEPRLEDENSISFKGFLLKEKNVLKDYFNLYILDSKTKIYLNPITKTYDPHVEDFIFSTTDYYKDKDVLRLGKPTTDFTIYQAMKNLSNETLNIIDNKHFVSNVNPSDPYLKTAFYLGVNTIVNLKGEDIEPVPYYIPSGDNLPIHLIKGEDGEANVLEDNTYVVSKLFYLEDDSVLSKMELLIKNMVNVRTLDNDVLKEVLLSWKSWNLESMFYFIPILNALIRYKLFKENT